MTRKIFILFCFVVILIFTSSAIVNNTDINNGSNALTTRTTSSNSTATSLHDQHNILTGEKKDVTNVNNTLLTHTTTTNNSSLSIFLRRLQIPPSCNPSANSNDTRQCFQSQLGEFPPYFYKGVFYKNQYCASCNFVTVATSMQRSTTEYCSYINKAEIPFDVKKCADLAALDRQQETLCHYYTFCGIPFPQFQRLRDSENFPQSNGLVSWNKLVEFRQSKKEEKRPLLKSVSKKCPQDMAYDKETKMCFRPFCRNGFQREGSECVQVDTHESHNLDAGGSMIFERCLFRDEMALYVQFKNSFRPFSKRKKRSIKKIVRKYFEKTQWPKLYVLREEFDILDRNFHAVITKSRSMIKHILLLRERVSHSSSLHRFDPKRNFPEHKYCAKPQEYSSYDFSIDTTCKIIGKNSTYNATSYNAFIYWNLRDDLEKKIVLCDQFYMNGSDCLMRDLEPDYTIQPNLDLIITHSHQTCSPAEYIPTEKGIAICISKNTTLLTTNETISANVSSRAAQTVYLLYPWFATIELVYAYTSIVGTSISLVSYAYLLGCFVKYRRYETVPQQIMIALCLSLFISDCLFIGSIAARRNRWVCKVVAILLHWFLLVSHLWSGAMAYEFAATFRNTFINRSVKCKKRIKKYIIVVMVSASLMVGIAFTLHSLRLCHAYDGKTICWISTFHSRLFLYIIPSTIISLFSGVVLVIACRNIRAVKRLSQHISYPKEGKSYSCIKVALKLALILGISEIIAVIQIRTNSISQVELVVTAVFMGAYTILRSFRGLIILLVSDRNSQTSQPKCR